MLQPLKRSGNRRYYRPADVALVETIDRLVNQQGYTLKGARQAIEEGRETMGEDPQAKPADAAGGADTLTEERLPDRVPGVAPASGPSGHVAGELRAIRDRLARAIER